MAGDGEGVSAPDSCSDVGERALIVYRGVQPTLPMPACNHLIHQGSNEGITITPESISIDSGLLQGVRACLLYHLSNYHIACV